MLCTWVARLQFSDDTLRDITDVELVFGQAITVWKASALLVSIGFGDVGVLAVLHR